MNADTVVRWAPRLAVGMVVAGVLWYSLVLSVLIGRAAPPQGPIVGFGIFAVVWGGFVYLSWRWEGAREWLLGQHSL